MSNRPDTTSDLVRNTFENGAFMYYDTKRNDALNLGLGHADGLYHHHFAVGDFDHRVLELAGEHCEEAINPHAAKHGYADRVRFHDRNTVDTRFPAASFYYVVTNETTMYVDLGEAFTEFARVLKPSGRYVLLT